MAKTGEMYTAKIAHRATDAHVRNERQPSTHGCLKDFAIAVLGIATVSPIVIAGVAAISPEFANFVNTI
jgi:hypothetical protein